MITKIIVLTLLGLIAVEGFAQEKSAPLSNEAKLEIELITKQQNDIDDLVGKVKAALAAPVNARAQAFMEKTCAGAKIPLDNCTLDTKAGVVKEKVAATPVPAKK